MGELAKDYVPYIPNVTELRKKLKALYVLTEYMKSEEEYVDFKESIYTLIKGCFEHKSCRECMVRFKFYPNDRTTFELQLRHFVILLFLLYPLVFIKDLTDVLDETFIPNFYTDIPKIDDYINYHLIDVLRDHNIKNTVSNQAISNVTYDLKRISTDFSLIMGVNLSTETFIELYQGSEVIRDLMETKFEEGVQPKEVEEALDEKQEILISEIKKFPNNNLAMILRSGTGIKYKQLTEFMIAQGMKPDIDGNVIPVVISNSTLIRGTEKPSEIYTDASGTRKSLILNKKVMGNAGYFGKKVLLLSLTLKLSTHTFDCGTKHLVRYKVANQRILNKLNDKYYRLTEDSAEALKVVNARKDTHLIGKTIYVRSIAKCALGDKTCHCCVGRTAQWNLDIASGFSGFESEEITKKINQDVLSAKHLLTTNSKPIEFCDAFDKFFTLTGDEIYPYITDSHGNENPFVEDIRDWAMYVNPDAIMKDDDFDADTAYSTFIANGKFEMVNIKTNDRIEIYTKDETEIYITPEAVSMLNKKRGYIFFRDIGEDMKIFNIIIANNELTKPLYEIMDLIGKEKKDGAEETIDSMCQKMVELCVRSNISASAVACECIVNRLIRAVDTEGEVEMERPDFRCVVPQPYKILTVNKCLVHNRDPFVGFASLQLKNQLLSDELVEEKWEPGYLAALFDRSVEYHADGIYA